MKKYCLLFIFVSISNIHFFIDAMNVLSLRQKNIVEDVTLKDIDDYFFGEGNDIVGSIIEESDNPENDIDHRPVLYQKFADRLSLFSKNTIRQTESFLHLDNLQKLLGKRSYCKNHTADHGNCTESLKWQVDENDTILITKKHSADYSVRPSEYYEAKFSLGKIVRPTDSLEMVNDRYACFMAWYTEDEQKDVIHSLGWQSSSKPSLSDKKFWHYRGNTSCAQSFLGVALANRFEREEKPIDIVACSQNTYKTFFSLHKSIRRDLTYQLGWVKLPLSHKIVNTIEDHPVLTTIGFSSLAAGFYYLKKRFDS